MTKNTTESNILTSPGGGPPVILPQGKLVILWAPKAACTTVFKWGFYQLGLLHAALYYRNWIHAFREDVYQKSHGREKAIREYDPLQYTHIRVGRNPYSRAVSSYLHAVRTGYADSEIKEAIGFTSESGFSFRDFVSFLETENLYGPCNPHHRSQLKQLEISGEWQVDRVLHIEAGLELALNALAEQTGMKAVDFTRPVFGSAHHIQYSSDSTGYANEKLSRLTVSDCRLPAWTAFYDTDLKQRVAGMYSRDFEVLGYEQQYPKEVLAL